MTTTHALAYADRGTARPPRRQSRFAVAAALWCPASALASFLLLLAAKDNALPQHFLCCKHPEVAVLVFVVVPAIGTLAGLVSVARIARSRGALGGWVAAAIAVVLWSGLTLVGWGLVQLVKM